MNKQNSGFLDHLQLSPVVRFFRLLAVDRKEILYIYIYALFNGLINLTIPLGIQAIINLVSGGQVSYSWIVLVGIVVLGTLFIGVTQIMQLAITERVQQNLFTRSAFEFSFRIPRLKIEQLKNQYTPELVNRFFDTFTIQKGLDKILIDFSTATFQILFGFILLSFYSPYFIFLTLFFILLAALIFWITGPAGIRAAYVESKHKYEVAYWLEELGRAMLTFKLAGIPGFTMNKTDNLVANWLKARQNHFRILLTQFISMVTLKVLVTAGLLVIGGLLVIDQQLNLGQFVAAEIIIVILLNSVEKLIRSLETIYDVVIGTEKISEITDSDYEDDGGAKVYDEESDQNGIAIKADNLGYYSELNDYQILKNINLDIKRGESICIAGFNASGKTVLIHLLAGLYEDYQGNIEFNGVPRQNVDVHHLRSKIGDNLLAEDVFYGTIKDNITLGKEVPHDLFNEAVNASGLSPYIKRMPKGYDTVIGPRSFLLSKTIVKSIILARSIARDPMLMVVEDDFFQFEKNKKQELIHYLTDANQKWTLVIVSNDRNVAESCDKVLVLSEGQLLADTNFENLKQEPWFEQIFA